VHHFVEYGVSHGRLILTPEGIYEYVHEIYRLPQNPLAVFRFKGIPLGLLLPVGFTIWLLASRRGRALSERQSYFLFLVICLFANPALFPMGVIACFPLLILLVDSSRTPLRTAVLLLAPMFLTARMLGGRNFTVFVLVAAFCVWQNGWLRGAPDAVVVEGEGSPA
jgi:hypothetical protein